MAAQQQARWALVCAVLLASRAPCQQVAPLTDAELIRIARRASNQAIARHDTIALARVFAPEFVSISSTNARSIGADSARSRYAQLFKTRRDVVFIRTPDSIAVNYMWGQAAESGRWTGRWTQIDGVTNVGGSYFAKWVKRGDHWLLLSETFVQTSCRGSNYCTSVP
jgi:hypothetical protein